MLIDRDIVLLSPGRLGCSVPMRPVGRRHRMVSEGTVTIGIKLISVFLTMYSIVALLFAVSPSDNKMIRK